MMTPGPPREANTDADRVGHVMNDGHGVSGGITPPTISPLCPKAEYLLRITQSGSRRAKVLKLADRISNITSLGFVHDLAFVRKYLRETRDCILPHAEQVNPDMFRELSHLVENREQMLGQ